MCLYFHFTGKTIPYQNQHTILMGKLTRQIENCCSLYLRFNRYFVYIYIPSECVPRLVYLNSIRNINEQSWIYFETMWNHKKIKLPFLSILVSQETRSKTIHNWLFLFRFLFLIFFIEFIQFHWTFVIKLKVWENLWFKVLAVYLHSEL